MKARHLTDKELQLARGEGEHKLAVERRNHLSSCEECSLAFQLLRIFPVSGRAALMSAPLDLILRAKAIPIQARVASAVRHVVEAATLLFDSWAIPAPAGVRGGVRNTRRIRYQTSSCSLDIQASRIATGWDCTARVVPQSALIANTINVKVGRLALRPDNSGFVSWQSQRPPQKITVLADVSILLQAEVSWNRPART